MLKDSDAIIYRIDVETLPEAWVHVEADREGKGGSISRAQGEAGGPARTRIVILADHAEWAHGKANLLKFAMSVKSGSRSTLRSNTGPMPEGKRLADVVNVVIKSGEPRYGEPTPILTFKDVTYRLSSPRGRAMGRIAGPGSGRRGRRRPNWLAFSSRARRPRSAGERGRR